MKNNLLIFLVVFFIVGQIIAEESVFKSEPMLGATLGIGPLMGLNLIGGYSYDRIGSLFTLGYKGENENLFDIQSNLFYKLYENRIFMHSIGIATGYVNYSKHDNSRKFEWIYGGLAYNINFYGVFVEIGLMKSKIYNKSGEPKPVDPFFQYFSTQFGVMHRFY